MPTPRYPRLLALYLVGCTLAACALTTHAGELAEVQVIDRSTGQTLPQYRHQGRIYIAGQPGHAYQIAVRNQTGERLLAVMSVDGVNVLSGATAGTGQGGYVFNAWESDRIKGWRKSLQAIAQFHFTALPNSYAARTGRPDNVGVIGVALFREQALAPDCCIEPPQPYAAAPAPSMQQRAEAGSAASDAAASPEFAPRKAAPKLGTGHGKREYDPIATTTFQRASNTPDEVISLYYDAYANLVAQGVLPRDYRPLPRVPEAFPQGFVADP